MSGGRLCQTCSVIPFNDEPIRPYVETADSSGARINIEAAAAEYPVDYRVVDLLPNLPCLQQSALQGCDFCSLLRLEIIRADFDYTGFVEITLVYHLGDFYFPGVGLAALVARLVWRPEIPSLPPASEPPFVVYDRIIFVLESDDEVGSWLKIPRLRKDDPLCEENIQFMRDTLADCVSNCNHSRTTEFLPSRLLDLGPETSLDSIRLVDSTQIITKEESNAPKYAALSYCWGSSLAADGIQHLLTKMSSVASMKRDVPQHSIPQAILDAIKVCKTLSIRYLWVDSLCIVQDNISDWERESASMTLIYKNALITICTPSSNASNQGFLTRNRRHLQMPFHSRVIPSINGHYNLVASGTCEAGFLLGWPDLDIDNSLWDSRGWTLQEYEMSDRLLIFGESMVHFECRKSISENMDGYHPRRVPRLIGSLDDAHSYPDIPLDHWQWVVWSYGYRNFTYSEDRLPGISGVAKYIADKYGHEYLAGLWKTLLPSALVWQALPNKNSEYYVELPDLLEMLRSPNPYIAPSWSPIRLSVYVKGAIRLDAGPPPRLFPESTVVDASVTHVGENLFGRVQHGRIRIRGRFMTVLSDLAKLPCHRPPPHLWFTLDRGFITYYHLDWLPPKTDFCDRGELSMLLISSLEPIESWHTRSHEGSCEAAFDCSINRLPRHVVRMRSTSKSSYTASEGQSDHGSSIAESEASSSPLRFSAIARNSEEGNNEKQDPTEDYSKHACSDGVDRLDESDSGSSGLSSSSEDRPRTPSAHNRDACGLLVHPLPGTNSYVRVGVWEAFAEDGGGIARFEDIDEREIDIV